MRRRTLNDISDKIVKLGENLLDYDDIEKGVYINIDGTFGKQTNYGTSDYIEVEPGARYLFYSDKTATKNVLYTVQRYSCAFDENKEVVGGASVYTQTASADIVVPIGGLVEFRENIKYIRFSSTIDEKMENDLYSIQIRKLLGD